MVKNCLFLTTMGENHLDRQIVVALPPEGSWLQEIDGACATLLRQWQSLALGMAEAEAAAWTGRRRRGIRDWVAKACANAGGGAHRFTKLPLGWRLDPCAENGRPLGR